MRLERKDDKLSVWISTVGEKWKDITTLETNLPSKVKVGVVACSASKGGYKPTFDKFMLFKKKEKNSRN